MLCVGFKTGLDVAGATLRKMHATSHATGAPPRVQRIEFLLFEERVRKLPKNGSLFVKSSDVQWRNLTENATDTGCR